MRMLAALVPEPGKTRYWTFKLVADPEAVAEIAEPFNGLLKSLKFSAKPGELPEWTLPTGWSVKPQPDDFGGADNPAAWEALVHVLLCSNEFIYVD